MTRLVRCQAVNIVGVIMADGCEKKWREGGKVMEEVTKCGKCVLCKLFC